MCGIVAYIGEKEAYPIVLNGLKRLEYRGYDSAGVAVLKNGNINTYKKEGKVYYFSDAVIMSVASLGGFYKSIYILKLFPKRIRDFVYNIFAKNRHLI